MAEAWVSTRVVTEEGERAAAVVVEAGRIVQVCGVDSVPRGVTVQDVGGAAILPGMVDTHVHINEPGRTEWEGFATATRAAAAGGITSVVDMPLNCLPETTTVAALEAKRAAAAGKCLVDWGAWGGAAGEGPGGGNQEHLLPLARAGVLGWKCFLIYPGCEGLTSIDAANLERAVPLIAESGLPLLVHAELAGPIAVAAEALAGEDWRRYETYLRSRPDEAEVNAVRMLIGLCRRYRFRLHIVHLASAMALDDLRAAKAEGLPLTVETCPHYLHFAAEEIGDGRTEFKCAPPIRSRANRELLWAGLREGVIDMIATDHSPCPPERKRVHEGRFDEAWGGIASLSTALSVVWTDAQRRGFGLSDVVRWMSTQTAALGGLSRRVGRLHAGCDANFVVFDAEAKWMVTPKRLHYRHKISPYMGEQLRGEVQATYLRGECVYRYEDGFSEFTQARRGKEYRFLE